MTLSLVLHDWRLLERIVGLTNRLGCAYTRVDVRANDDLYHATIDFVGSPDALRRLDAQLSRLLNDDKEMSR
jgi:acetolactate synthase regulatory subunit